MMCDILPGDIVVDGAPCACPNQHDDSWLWSEEMAGKYYRVTGVEMNHPTGCVCLRLRELPGSVWCWGTFRKVRPSTQTVAQMIAQLKPVPQPA